MHVITDLKMGGAEMALLSLLSGMDRAEFHSKVVALSDDQPVGNMIRNMGIEVKSLNARPGIPDPRMILNLRKEILRFSPDIIQTWMYHSDLVGALSARLAGKIPVVWGIHHTVSERNALRTVTHFVAKLNAFLSHFLPARIVCVADLARKTHADFGYDSSKIIVIPNGIDVELFQPSANARDSVRMALGLPQKTYLVGLCARYDPLKDHPTFLRAASLLVSKFQGVHFMLWGKNVDLQNKELVALIEDMKLSNCVHLLGIRLDGAHLFAALDMLALSSISEAQPQVLGEAMACGVPCATTDVGDCAFIVGKTGRVVPARDPVALANAMQELLREDRGELGHLARERIIDLFSKEKMVSAYGQLYRDIIAGSSVK